MQKLFLFLLLVGCSNSIKFPLEASYNCSDIVVSLDSVEENKISLNISSEYNDHFLYQKEGGEFVPFNVINSQSIIIEDLDYEREYIFKVVHSNKNTFCSSNELIINTKARTKFADCQEIKIAHPEYLNGVYILTKDDEELNVYCNMEQNDGGWTLVMNHDVNYGFFTNEDVLLKNKLDPEENLYSILSYLETFRRGYTFEFWLHYEDLDATNGGNIWNQDSNPTTEVIDNYVAIREDHTIRSWGGLEYNGGTTLMDGSIDGGSWYYAVGVISVYGGATTVPGPGSSVSRYKLYVR